MKKTAARETTHTRNRPNKERTIFFLTGDGKYFSHVNTFLYAGPIANNFC